MSVRRLSKSYISGGGNATPKSSSFLASYSPAIDEMDLISRVTVGASGAASITFSNIPQTYQHLQIRILVRSTRTTVATDSISFAYNSDSSTANYIRYHELGGDGASAYASAQASGVAAQNLVVTACTSTATTGIFAAAVVDFLDYASNTKFKVVRGFGGHDRNGAGLVSLNSAAWLSTNAISQINITPNAGPNFAEYSVASLYGVKA